MASARTSSSRRLLSPFDVSLPPYDSGFEDVGVCSIGVGTVVGSGVGTVVGVGVVGRDDRRRSDGEVIEDVGEIGLGEVVSIARAKTWCLPPAGPREVRTTRSRCRWRCTRSVGLDQLGDPAGSTESWICSPRAAAGR